MKGGMAESGFENMENSLPFALERLEIFDGYTSSMWAHIRYSDGNLADEIKKLDIDLCDEQGKICVRMQGFCARMLKDDSMPATASFEIPEKLLN